MPISTYAGNKMLDTYFGDTVWTVPSTLYPALMDTDPTVSGGGHEGGGGSYARPATTNNLTNFPAAVNGAKVNATALNFGSPTGSTWTSIGWYDAPTGGNLLFWTPLTPALVTTGGNATQPVGTLSFAFKPAGVFLGIGGSTWYMDNIMLDHLFGAQVPTVPSTWYFAIANVAPLASTVTLAGIEVVGGSYTREFLVNNTTNFPNASGLQKLIATALLWPTPTADWGGSLPGLLMTDASSSGNLWVYIMFNNGNPISILNGDPAQTVPANSTTIAIQ